MNDKINNSLPAAENSLDDMNSGAGVPSAFSGYFIRNLLFYFVPLTLLIVVTGGAIALHELSHEKEIMSLQ